MMNKTCFKCRERKPLSEFYRHSGMADGHLGKCKDCTRKDVKANRANNHEHYLEFDRQRANQPDRVQARKDYGQTFAGKLSHFQANRKWRQANTDKQYAHTVVANAIKTGRLERKPCEVCQNPKSHAHHDDYSKPLDVLWLCPKHHKERHRQLKLAEAA